jgi:hypothetical protein
LATGGPWGLVSSMSLIMGFNCWVQLPAENS